MKKTNIQWCHSTVNPVMGCDGCELWLRPTPLAEGIVTFISEMTGKVPRELWEEVVLAVVDHRTSELYRDRKLTSARLAQAFALDEAARDGVVDVIRSGCRCYAGLLGTMRAGHKG